ncbi:MAG: hypothetical protein DRQ47_06325, partial [Gammaproteobacteria bacterium]
MNTKTDNQITKVAVIGAGTMGAAIAQHFLMKNLQVVLLDVQQEGLKRGIAEIDKSLSEAVERRILSDEKKQALLSNLKSTTQYADLADRQFIVEAVFENFDVKQSVFAEVERNVSPECIIASNTSSFSISELGSKLAHQDRFLGVHYFYHAAKNKLIEVIPGKNTDQTRVDELVNFYYANDKAPIVVADVYGFAVNRFFVPWLTEAVRLYEEGLGSIAFIDEVAVKVFGVGMGPFALMNATGVPIALHSAETLEENFGAMYAPSQTLREQVAKGEDWDCSSTALINTGATDNEQLVKNRLLAFPLGVAAQMVSEGVTSATEADLGARLGLRWPLGPFELMNQIGVSTMEDIVTQAFEKFGQPTPSIFSETDHQKGFIVEHVKAHAIGTT